MVSKKTDIKSLATFSHALVWIHTWEIVSDSQPSEATT